MNELLDRLKRGENAAIKEVYRLAFPACQQLVTSHHGTVNDARDLFQDALVILHRKTRQPDFNLSCTLKTYLYSVVRNLWMQKQTQHRKKGLELVIDEPDQEFIIIEEDELEAKREVEQKHQIIANSMAELKEECQKILLGFYYKKQSLTDLAAELGYTGNFIKVKKGRCMKSLQEKAHHSLTMLGK